MHPIYIARTKISKESTLTIIACMHAYDLMHFWNLNTYFVEDSDHDLKLYEAEVCIIRFNQEKVLWIKCDECSFWLHKYCCGLLESVSHWRSQGRTRQGPDPPKFLPSWHALPLRLQKDWDTLIEQSNILLKQSVAQVVPCKLTQSATGVNPKKFKIIFGYVGFSLMWSCYCSCYSNNNNTTISQSYLTIWMFNMIIR